MLPEMTLRRRPPTHPILALVLLGLALGLGACEPDDEHGDAGDDPWWRTDASADAGPPEDAAPGWDSATAPDSARPDTSATDTAPPEDGGFMDRAEPTDAALPPDAMLLEAVITEPTGPVTVGTCAPLQLSCMSVTGTELQYRWSSSLIGGIGEGPELNWTPNQTGEHEITCEAYNAEGQIGWAHVTVTVVSPFAAITGPEDLQVISPGSWCVLSGSGCDLEDGELSGASLRWSSDQDGVLGQDSPLTLTPSPLSLGRHTITFEVTDSAGNTAVDSIELMSDTPPSVGINSPFPSTSGYLGFTTFEFRAVTNDAEDGPLPATWWDSTLGEFGTGNSVDMHADALGLGKHSILAQVTDSLGVSSFAGRALYVYDDWGMINPALPGVIASAVGEDPNDSAYWISAADGLYKWRSVSDTHEHFQSGDSALPSDDLRDVAVLADGSLAVASAAGLALCPAAASGQTGHPGDCAVHSGASLGLASEVITAIQELPDGRLVLGSEDCLVLWDRDSSATVYCQGDGEGDGLVDSIPVDLVYDSSRDELWIATASGASLATLPAAPATAGVSFSTINSIDGLPSDDVRGVAVAPSGAIWLATAAGLVHYDRSGASPAVQIYTSDHGLIYDEINAVGVTVVPIDGSDHEITWAATDWGLSRIDPLLMEVIPLHNLVMNLSSAEGLSHDTCLTLSTVANGHKLVSTSSGVDVYRGL